MQNTPLLTDQDALKRFRTRAKNAQNPVIFLQQEVACQIQERLNEVNRRFKSVAIITNFPEFWQKIFPEALIVPDAEVLALKTGAHDLVLHLMSLHWANDFVGQLIQCHRALKPDGLFIAACFGGETLSELRKSLAQAEISITGGLSPRIAPMGEIRELGSLLQRAGYALPVADAHLKTVSYKNMAHLMQDLRGMGEGNALAQRRKLFAPRELFAKAAEIYAAEFPAENQRIRASFELIFLTGWAPDDSQQKPLRPGSATARLADALYTDELIIPGTDDGPEKRV
jgi:SAM-dependent methyltransferase